jgi:4-hydroxythreonine-4-phosphate dehydrogenase
MTLPAVGITPGDPGGIGPEVILKAFLGSARLPEARYVFVGGKSVLAAAGAMPGLELDLAPWTEASPPEAPGLYSLDIAVSPAGIVRGYASGENGRVSFRAFAKAVEMARGGSLDAIVTAPISKTSWHLAGLPWRGHTEYLESFYPGAIMSFWSEKLRVALLSHHLPLKEALGRVRKEILLEFFRSLHRDLEKASSGVGEILVAGLNPHAGEEGLLGGEEIAEIRPAIEAAAREGLPVAGPFPPDTVFLKALGKPGTMVVALYHDQGLIAFKAAAFDSGVNATLGMPFIRTSPDHGTAFDIAGKGIADPGSMIEAVRLAVKLS